MSMIGLRVPVDVGRLLHTIPVPGEKESVDNLHITIACFDDEMGIDDVAKILAAAYKVTSGYEAFTVETVEVGSFSVNPETKLYPIIAKVQSPTLHDLRCRLLETFDRDGVQYSKKFPVYQPHVTLAYSKDNVKKLSFNKIEWAAAEAVLWGGDHGDNRLAIPLPFSVHVKQASRLASQREGQLALRIASRFKSQW